MRARVCVRVGKSDVSAIYLGMLANCETFESCTDRAELAGSLRKWVWVSERANEWVQRHAYAIKLSARTTCSCSSYVSSLLLFSRTSSDANKGLYRAQLFTGSKSFYFKNAQLNVRIRERKKKLKNFVWFRYSAQIICSFFFFNFLHVVLCIIIWAWVTFKFSFIFCFYLMRIACHATNRQSDRPTDRPIGQMRH